MLLIVCALQVKPRESSRTAALQIAVRFSKL
jgi:hypothetical protein